MKYLKIRDELAAAAALTEAAYLDTAWSEKQIREIIGRDDTTYLVAVDDERLCAVISCVFSLYEGMIENLAVEADYRRKGLAVNLLSLIEQEGKKRKVEQLVLEVASRNASAVALYEKAGFKKVGVRKGFYSKQNDDALVMIKEIKQ